MKQILKRVDLMTIIGLTLGTVGLLVEVYSKIGKESVSIGAISHFINLPAFLLIALSSLGATLIGHSWEEVKHIPKLTLDIFKAEDLDPEKTIDLLAVLSEKARREGLLKLEDELKGIHDVFLRTALQLVIDGTDMELLQQMMMTRIESMKERHKKTEAFYADWGGFAPTIGIIGTVMGLVHVLGNLGGDMNALGEGIARAFLATLYGIMSANIIFLPFAGKLKLRTQEEVSLREMMIEGILSIQSGDNPRLLREKLLTYLPPKQEPKAKVKGAAKGSKSKKKAAEPQVPEMSEVGSPK